MIQSIVDQNCEAIIRVAVGNADSQKQTVDAVMAVSATRFVETSLPSGEA
jgi:hypothetical protein